LIFGGEEKRRLREELEQKDRRLREARRQLVARDAEIEALRSRLIRGRNPDEALVFFLTGRAKSARGRPTRSPTGRPSASPASPPSSPCP
jgi:hypothetical protein